MAGGGHSPGEPSALWHASRLRQLQAAGRGVLRPLQGGRRADALRQIGERQVVRVRRQRRGDRDRLSQDAPHRGARRLPWISGNRVRGKETQRTRGDPPDEETPRKGARGIDVTAVFQTVPPGRRTPPPLAPLAKGGSRWVLLAGVVVGALCGTVRADKSVAPADLAVDQV